MLYSVYSSVGRENFGVRFVTFRFSLFADFFQALRGGTQCRVFALLPERKNERNNKCIKPSSKWVSNPQPTRYSHILVPLHRNGLVVSSVWKQCEFKSSYQAILIHNFSFTLYPLLFQHTSFSSSILALRESCLLRNFCQLSSILDESHDVHDRNGVLEGQPRSSLITKTW